MPLISDSNVSIASVPLAEQVSTPATPPSGKRRIYAKADGIYMVDSAGVATGPFGASETYDPTGWVATGETWTYASADSPSFTLTITGDLTSKYSAGMRVKLTQTTVKYFIITKVAYGAPNTTLTLYGGTDYTLANAAISASSYSTQKAPFGFPLDPAKWTVRVTDPNFYSQSTPVANTWYNLNSTGITIPIGVWNTRYQVDVGYSASSSTALDMFVTLSTANNSQSDINWTCSGYVQNGTYLELTFFRAGAISATSKTSYYLNVMTDLGGASTVLYLNSYANNKSPLVLEAVCAYL